MDDSLFSLRSSTVPLRLSALLHLLAFIPEGFTVFAGIMAVIGVLYFVIAYGLMSRMRWLGYVTFIIMLGGTIVAYANTGGPGLFSNLWYWLILAADLATAVILFVVLWRPREAAA